MESSFRLGPDKIIVVYPQEGHGSGDYATAYKVASNFCTEEGIPHHQIVLAARHPERFAPFNDLEFALVDRETFYYERINSVALLVLAPLQEPYFPIPFFPPSIGLFEYGYPNGLLGKKVLEDYISSASFGLLEGEIGVMIDPELRMWKMSGIMKDPKKRIELLTKLKAPLQQAILGDTSSPDPISEFVEKKKLYLGYAYSHEAQESFIEAILEYVKDHFPVIVLPNCKHGNLSRSLKERLEIISYEMASDTCTVLESPRDSLGKLIIGHVSNSAFKVIMGAAECQTLTTGDSSAAEAISAGKLAIYEASAHKDRFARGLYRKYGRQIHICENRRRFDARHVTYLFTSPVDNVEDPSVLDAWPQIRRLSLEALNKGRTQTQPTRYHGYKEMEFGSPYIIPVKELVELQIDESGMSLLPELSDSRFFCNRATLATLTESSFFLIVRNPLYEAVPESVAGSPPFKYSDSFSSQNLPSFSKLYCFVFVASMILTIWARYLESYEIRK